ncbi:unnamed protein product [Adineta ricciae]|uniref:G-protein coupled receptors family 1 profile domain-containing protein n=1 Tax=Adineta ricciae TaxID=249248 RepID=A0A814S6B9_ADIRI|nr:unnamed protein product [Adineta ricciae]CAF1502312.1 unnamed protein product [Adineta ricciae]
MNELWMSIYTFIVAVILPSLINTILNSLIFVHVRSSGRRVQPNIVTAWTSEFNREQQQLPKISRREIALLRQMVFMFIMFVTGWSAVLIVNIITQVVYTSAIFVLISMLLAELCAIGIIIDLYVYNHELRKFLCNKFQLCFKF